MGMTIEERFKILQDEYTHLMGKYQMMQADYNARLKADLEAILVELQLEIAELRLDRPLMSRGYECYGYEDKTPTEIRQECSDIIQEKINKLKESEDKE